MSGRLHHVSLTCSDLNKSLEFYQDQGFFIEKHYTGDDSEIVLLKGEAGRIELFFFNKKITPCSREKTHFLHEYRLTHLAFSVNNIDEVHKKFQVTGYTCSEISNARLGGFRYFFTQDPDGNFVEFIEEIK